MATSIRYHARACPSSLATFLHPCLLLSSVNWLAGCLERGSRALPVRAEPAPLPHIIGCLAGCNWLGGWLRGILAQPGRSVFCCRCLIFPTPSSSTHPSKSNPAIHSIARLFVNLLVNYWFFKKRLAVGAGAKQAACAAAHTRLLRNARGGRAGK